MGVLNKEFKLDFKKRAVDVCRLARVRKVLWNKGLGKVSCTVDGEPLRTAFMAMGGGVHRLPPSKSFDHVTSSHFPGTANPGASILRAPSSRRRWTTGRLFAP